MNLSDLQNKEVIDVSSGRRIGSIVDVIIDKKGTILRLILEDRKPARRLFSTSKEDLDLLWNQIVKIGDDIILVNCENQRLN